MAHAADGGRPLPPAITFNASEFHTDFTKHTVPLSSFARYGLNPYAGSDSELSRPLHTTENADDRRLLPKDRVVFVLLGRMPVAVPLAVFEKRVTVTVSAGGRTAVIRRTGWTASPLAEPGVHRGRRIPVVSVTENGRPLPFDTPFWFSVAAFSPEVRLTG